MGTWHLLSGLEAEIKALIVEALALEDVQPEEIETEAPLFVEGLGLDSIDALELAMALEERYGVAIEDDPERNRGSSPPSVAWPRSCAPKR